MSSSRVAIILILSWFCVVSTAQESEEPDGGKDCSGADSQDSDGESELGGEFNARNGSWTSRVIMKLDRTADLCLAGCPIGGDRCDSLTPPPLGAVPFPSGLGNHRSGCLRAVRGSASQDRPQALQLGRPLSDLVPTGSIMVHHSRSSAQLLVRSGDGRRSGQSAT